MYQGQDGNVGAGLQNNQVFSSPQSDIVLSTQKNKKSKIWIVTIAAILVLVTIVMIVLFMPKKGTTGSGGYAKEKCANLILATVIILSRHTIMMRLKNGIVIIRR